MKDKCEKCSHHGPTQVPALEVSPVRDVSLCTLPHPILLGFKDALHLLQKHERITLRAHHILQDLAG